MNSADTFVILDNVQLPGKGLANRNYIKGKDGKKVLLTVPIKKTSGVNSTYNDAIADASKLWQKEHLNKIKDAYFKAPYFEQNFWRVEQLILNNYENLGAMNSAIIQNIGNWLEIKTNIVLASTMQGNDLQKNERNVSLCLQMGAKTYLSGQGAKKYNDEELFAANHLAICYQSFQSPIYNQIGTDFIPNLSVLDMLFNLDLDEIKLFLNS